MIEPILPVFVHSLTACPCGHSEHIGRGLESITAIVCPECDDIAGDNILTVVSVETAQQLALNIGSRVKCGGRTLSIVSIDQITKLWGALATEWVRVVMA